VIARDARPPSRGSTVPRSALDSDHSQSPHDVYRDLHANPELSFAEHRTAGVVAAWLGYHGYEVIENVGRTGVVGVLANGDGPVIALRADMDALPVAEATGLPYASTTRATTTDGDDVPVMHACGHDMHVVCLLGACAELVRTREEWTGTVVAVFQPAEELAQGAQAMVDDGLYDRVPRPDVLLGQHVAPLPAGTVGIRSGDFWAASDSLRVVLYGAGGHGSRPETTVDPVVMAASLVLRLQTIVSRQVAAAETAVVTIGSLNAGNTANIIPDCAELMINVRSVDPEVRSRVLAAITRIARAEAVAAGAPREPEITLLESAPTLTNDPAATERTLPALASVVGPERILDPGPVPSSEDVPILATSIGAPLVFWLLGGADPALYANARTVEQMQGVAGRIPSNHSPLYAPVISPTLEVGIATLVAAARVWLDWRPTGSEEAEG
jgi:amidohydrolase